MTDRGFRLIEPFDIVEGRLTGLLGLLWFVGGLFPLIADPLIADAGAG